MLGDGGGGCGDEAELDGRRAPCVGRDEGGQPPDHGQELARFLRRLAHGRQIAAQKQHLRCLTGLVGILPQPGTLGIAAAAGLRHRVAQRRSIDSNPSREAGQQARGGVEQGGSVRVRCGVCRGIGLLGRRQGGAGGMRAHGKILWAWGWGRARFWALARTSELDIDASFAAIGGNQAAIATTLNTMLAEQGFDAMPEFAAALLGLPSAIVSV